MTRAIVIRAIAFLFTLVSVKAQDAPPTGSATPCVAASDPGQPEYTSYRLKAGPLCFSVERLSRTNYSDLLFKLTDQLRANFSIKLGEKQVLNFDQADTNLLALTDQINKSGQGLQARVTSAQSGNKLQVTTTTKNPLEPLTISGNILPTPEASAQTPMTFLEGVPDYKITFNEQDLAPAARTALAQVEQKAPVKLYVRGNNGAVPDLRRNMPFFLTGSGKPVVTLVLGNDKGPLCANDSSFAGMDSCHVEYLLARRLQQRDVVIAATITGDGMIIGNEILQDSQQFILVNGQVLSADLGQLHYDPNFATDVSIYRRIDGCRLYARDPADWATIPLYRSLPLVAGAHRDGGITVGPAKIFDSFALRKMLNDTAAQLAGISGFSPASITNAFGSLQGVTRDTSYLALQATTTPLPGVTSTTSSGLTNGTSGSLTLPVLNSPGSVTVQCPDGTLPSVGSGGVQGCTAASSPTGNGSSSITTVPAGTNQQGTTSQATQQAGQTVTAPSIAGTIPSAPVSTALAAPSNVSASSADLLAEQVQLNAQITTLRLLLQGANSDQYLTASAHAVGVRQQTTLGLAVSLDPPRQYKRAVAEVRVVIIPPVGRDPVSIMALLPAEKNYNVAKITSHQTSFGAGVAIEPVSVGVNTGKAKDRLYLAKDTDTVALQFPPQDVAHTDRPVWQALRDGFRSVIGDNPLHDCDALTSNVNGAVVFGWQFRPVLGADYVKGGQRQVFAQLALPSTLDDSYSPTVYIQTRWRDYDPKSQVVGAVYKDSCSVSADRGDIAFLNPLRIRSLVVNDIGNGQVRLSANGDFYSSSMNVRSGPTNVLPTTFDGTNIEVFGSLHDLLQVGDMNIVAQNGIKQPFAIATNPSKLNQCGITDVVATAVPQPDGNSRVQLKLTLGSAYNRNDNNDGDPHPFVMIGSNLYGVQETPYVDAVCTQQTNPRQPATCEYAFLAPTSVVRNSQGYLVEDLSWDSFRKHGTFSFAPAFTSMSVSTTIAATDTTVYSIAGFNLLNLDFECTTKKAGKYCATLSIGTTDVKPAPITVSTDTLAVLSLTATALGKAKAVRIRLPDVPVEWDLAVPKADDPAKISASPALLFTGDSVTVSLTGGDLDYSTLKDVLFDGKVFFTPSSKPSATKLDLIIPTDVTKVAGHKVFTLELTDSTGKIKPATFAIDVARR